MHTSHWHVASEDHETVGGSRLDLCITLCYYLGNKLYSALSLIYNGTTKPFGNPTCNERAFPAEGRKEKMLLVAKQHMLQRLHAIIYVCLSVSLSTYQKPHATIYMYLSPTLALMSHLA